MTAPDILIQTKALEYVRDYRRQSDDLTTQRRQALLEIYRSWVTFFNYSVDNSVPWQPGFKVNKAHEVVEKTLPRLVGNNPKWVVSTNQINSFAHSEEETELEQQIAQLKMQLVQTPSDQLQMQLDQLIAQIIEKRTKRTNEYAIALQDYLNYVWDKGNLMEPVRQWVKLMVIYGKSYAKIGYKYEITRDKKEEYEEDENGDEVPRAVIDQRVTGEYPTIEVRSWKDMYYDPRFVRLEDRPGMIEIRENVRVADLMKREDYFNLDKVQEMAAMNQSDFTDPNGFISRLRLISGITDVDASITTGKNTVDLMDYYGVFSETGKAKDEKLYKICVASNNIVIAYKEITQQPFEEIKCFEDPETAFARGFVEPIVSIQNEMNFKKNAAAEYINKALMRQLLLSSSSGIDPTTINSPVVLTNKTIADELALGHREWEKPEINSSYFTEQNDLQREIQAMTFTVDTSSNQNSQALTNTATGIRVKFFESNSVLAEIRTHVEKGLERLAYKLIQETFENMDDNIVIKKQGTEGYWQINKELMRDAVEKYNIKIEVNSSSADYIQDRRDDAIASWNIGVQAVQMGVPVDLEKEYVNVMETFERVNPYDLIKKPTMPEILQQMGQVPPGQPQVTGSPSPLPETPSGSGSPAALTDQVAGGKISSP